MYSLGLQAVWEARLVQENMAAAIGYEAEQHGKARQRVLSLDVYFGLDEHGMAWATWDEYVFDQEDEAQDDHIQRQVIPEEIRAIGEKRLLGLNLTAVERKRLQRFRDGTYTGQRGRPKNVTQANQSMRGNNGSGR